ncbi:expressed unknown protein [Seminavis robusta]|uniref:Uncharacterized protein n=1 Tax=Seminavis robusta TaxID=568900 RepID=A0A9N8D550_9STRA|nr:expressed unknown protein [Seminavis robusta]|eukprot:Sro3_g002290.1 n/a (531) ;mRNA; r:108524-110116
MAPVQGDIVLGGTGMSGMSGIGMKGPPSTIDVPLGLPLSLECELDSVDPVGMVPPEVEIVKHRAPNVVRLLEQQKKKKKKSKKKIADPPPVIQYSDSIQEQELQLQLALKKEDDHWRHMRQSQTQSKKPQPQQDEDQQLKALSSYLVKSARKATTSHHIRDSNHVRDYQVSHQIPRARPQQQPHQEGLNSKQRPPMRRSISVPSLASVSTRDVMDYSSSCNLTTATEQSVSTAATATATATAPKEIGVDFSGRYTSTRRNSIDRKLSSYEQSAFLYDSVIHNTGNTPFTPPTPQFMLPSHATGTANKSNATTSTRATSNGNHTAKTNSQLPKLQPSMLAIFPGASSSSATTATKKHQSDAGIDSSYHSSANKTTSTASSSVCAGKRVVCKAPAPPKYDDDDSLPGLSPFRSSATSSETARHVQPPPAARASPSTRAPSSTRALPPSGRHEQPPPSSRASPSTRAPPSTRRAPPQWQQQAQQQQQQQQQQPQPSTRKNGNTSTGNNNSSTSSKPKRRWFLFRGKSLSHIHG